MSLRNAIAFASGSLVVAAALAASAAALSDGGAAAKPVATDLLAPADWKAVPADGVELTLAADVDERGRPALRLDYDFRGHGGWAAARRPLALVLPENYDLRFRYRAEGAVNHLEVKLVDATGDNVWWNVAREVAPAAAWSERRIAKRAITFAWGPSSAPLERIAALELAVVAGNGGRGSFRISDLELVSRPPVRPYAGRPKVSGSAGPAIDGDPATAWSTTSDRAVITVDYGEPRELGGLTLRWAEGGAPASVRIELSDDGADWRAPIELPRAGAARNDLALPESEARFLRLAATRRDGAAAIALAEIEVRDLAFGATTSSFLTAIADETPRGTWPRALTEGSLWTVVGVDGDAEEALVSEDGVVEAGERSFSLEPFVDFGAGLTSWSNGVTAQSLVDRDLPIPIVTRTFDEGKLTITTLAAGAEGSSSIRVRYAVAAPAARPLSGRLLLAVRPFQVNPPQQFLNVAGGAAPISTIACRGDGVDLNGRTGVRFDRAPSRCGAAAFAEGQVLETAASGRWPGTEAVEDPQRLATAIAEFPLTLAAGESTEIVADIPFPGRTLADRLAPFETDLERERQAWTRTLDRVELSIRPDAGPVVDEVKTALAHILIHRDGPAIQPGSRAYARSWIRDGALTGVALLRLGHDEPVRDFARWFAKYQYDDGKVPCCVDRRGADPVPENDSHGELIHLISEVYRYTRDRAFLAEMFPHVRRAADYIERLRQSRRTAEYSLPGKEKFFGLLPESISHEGYSSKPVHSYWDDTFADVGLRDAALLAREMGESALATEWEARHREFRVDFLASIERVRAERNLAGIPASADLGDNDSTSTTTMLDPGSLLPDLDRAALESTMGDFARSIGARREGAPPSTFTPYEVRHIGSFVRLGWRERAHEALEYYLTQRRPAAWNQWPEAHHPDVRARNFLGDLPHGWVASDYIRSTLDLFAFERREDRALILAAGVPADWLRDGDRVAVRGLRTPWGALDYEVTRRGEQFHVRIAALERTPEGGLELRLPDAAPVRVAGLPAELTVERRIETKEKPE